MNLRRSVVILTLFIVTLALVMAGLVILASSSASLLSRGHDRNMYVYLGRQLMWLAVGLGLMGLATQFDYNLLRPWSRPLLLLTIGLLAAVLWSPLGWGTKGATRWLELGPLRFQPSELAKLTMILYLAESWSRRYEELGEFWRGALPSFAVIGLVLALIFPQPDKGTAFFLGLVCMMLWFVAGGQLKRILPILGVLVIVTLALILRDNYSLQRLTDFTSGKDSHHIKMSKIALANGGWKGVGIGEGRQQGGFTPESHTDFIFSVYAEELGLIGCILLLTAFSTIVALAIYVALKCDDLFGSLLATGCGLCIGLQALLNIAVVTKSAPTTGISLPFISYGGSSLAIFMIMVGLIINVARSTLRAEPSREDLSSKRPRKRYQVRTATA
ncbi:MAG: putative peptidoglycan glycosyltransferase FtsW [bacterium]